MNPSTTTYVPEAFNFQPKSKTGAIKVFNDGNISVLGIKIGMDYQTTIKELSKGYKIEYASSPDKNIIQVDNICINPRATSCMVCFDFHPTTNTLESITLVSKYATNFCWCFREMKSIRFVEFSESTSKDNRTYWFHTEKCQIKVSCYSFESSGKTIEKQRAKITNQKSNNQNNHLIDMKQQLIQSSFWRIFAIITLLAFCIIGYFNACRSRYHSFAEGELIIDSWTGEVYETENCIVALEKGKSIKKLYR